MFIFLFFLLIPPFVAPYTIAGGLTFGSLLFLTYVPLSKYFESTRILPMRRLHYSSIFLIGLAVYSLALICFNQIIGTIPPDMLFDDIFISLRMLYFLYALIVIGKFAHASFNNIKTCLKSLIFALFVALIYAWAAWSFNPRFIPFANLPLLHSITEGSWQANRNYLGFYSGLLFSLLFFIDLRAKNLNILLKVILLMVGVSSVLTFSRSAILSSFIPVILTLIARNFYKIKRLKLTKTFVQKCFFSSLLIVLLTLSFFQPLLSFTVNSSELFITTVVDRFIGDTSKGINTTNDRLIYKIDAFNIFLDHPLGIGPKRYSEMSRNYSLETGDPHDGMLQLLAEYGIPGLLLLIYFLINLGASMYFSLRYIRICPYVSILFSGILSLLIQLPLQGLAISTFPLYFLSLVLSELNFSLRSTSSFIHTN